MSAAGTGGLTRRGFLARALAAAAALASAARPARVAAAAPAQPKEGTVRIEEFSAAGVSLGVHELPRVVKTEAEWQALLSPAAFRVTRQEGTELPFSGEYDQNRRVGLYRCICCDTALFDSRAKFDSGTGWPSFWQAISHLNVAEGNETTLGVVRTAVSCRRCAAHLGHVFADGPRPTGLRYCMNSVALKFVPHA